MRLRSIAAVSAGLTLSLVIVSCSGEGGGADSASDGEPMTITFDYWDPLATETAQQLADEFMAEHTNITVELIQTPYEQYFTRLQTAISGGNPPDVFVMNGPNFQLYASNGALLPLTEHIEGSDVDPAAYPEDLNALYTYEDEQFGIPVNFATIGFWYNKDLFDQAGVDYPDETWTWQDVKDAAAKITDEDAGVYGIAAGSDPGAFGHEGYYNTIHQAGGYVVSDDGTESGFDDPKSIDGLQYWRDLLDAGVSPTYRQMVETSPSQMFQSGKIAMFYGGVWRAAHWKDSGLTTVDVTRLPAGPEGRTSTIHGTANVIAADSEHTQAAWEFVNFMSSEESHQAFGDAGALIPAYEGTQDAWLESMPEYNLQAYVDALDDTVPFPISQNTTAWSESLSEFLAPAWEGEVPVEQAAASVAEDMDAKLAEEG